MKPQEYTEHGHRKYNAASKDISTKYLDLSLKEISEYLKQPEQDFSKTLATQSIMLEEKKKQIETILEVIARVQQTVLGPEEIDSNSLFILIHALKNEKERERWIHEHASDSVFDKLHSFTAQLEMDKEMTAWTSKMKRFIQEGKEPNDPEVLDHTEAMISVMKPEVAPLLDDEKMKQLVNNEGSFEEPNPYLFPSAFTKEEEKFMVKVIEELVKSKVQLVGTIIAKHNVRAKLGPFFGKRKVLFLFLNSH